MDGRYHSFVSNGTAFAAFDLERAKDTLSFGLNDEGKIVGYYRDAAGVHPFLAGPIPMTTCDGDFDNDGDVDRSDLAVFVVSFSRTDCSGDCPGDYNRDDDVDSSDLAVFVPEFGQTDCLP